MAKPLVHAQSSARRFGGHWRDSLAIHDALDSTKRCHPKMAHRLVFHSREGIALLAQLMPTGADFEVIARQHIEEDLGFVPDRAEWSSEFDPCHPWVKAPLWRVEDHCIEDAARLRLEPDDLRELHQFIHDHSRCAAGRATMLSAFGCYIVEQRFGPALEASSGRLIATRDLAEAHILRTLKLLPSLHQWLDPINRPWMAGQRKATFVIVD